MLLKSIKIGICLSFALLFFSSALLAQDEGANPQTEFSRDSLLHASRTIIDSAKCRVLVTVDENGRPHAREMDPFAPDENMVIWFGTNPKTRKVQQIKSNPNVAVFYYDSKSVSYVSINGTAELVNDPELKKKYWKDYWERYYADPEKEYILIKVVPERLELISYQYNLFWKGDSFMPQAVDFDTGEKGK
jgi:general stress protein 26